MEKPLVSVVTITRNRGKLIGRCIQSVLDQTYKNIEHIVVDGASDDITDEVISGFKDNRLKFVKLDENWPIKETLDYGVSLCKGKYLTFLDSDDEYLPTKIEKQLSLLESLSDDYGFVYCWMTYYDSSQNNKVLHIHNPQLRGFVADEVVGKPIISGTPTLMFRIDFFRSFGGWKDVEEIGIASDAEMCARACQLCKVDYIPESLVNIYENHGSIRQSENEKYYKDAYLRQIKFHQYCLSQFSANYKRRPEKAVFHCFLIAVCNFHLHNNKEFVKYIFKSLRYNAPETIKFIFGRKK